MISAAMVAGLLAPTAVVALENTKVMPKGVRNLNVREVSTYLRDKTDSSGTPVTLAQPLQKDLTFQTVLNGEKNVLKRKQLEAFLLTESPALSREDALGTFTADLNAAVRVMAPIFGYGINKKTTLALAVPVYAASTDVKVGFRPNNEVAGRFFGLLNASNVNQPASAAEAADKINSAVSELQSKLERNGYSTLGPWNATGPGDMTVAIKQLISSGELWSSAYTVGTVLPTGRVDDPDNLTDLAFGDGQTDIFASLILDEAVGGGVVFNQYAKYTYQNAGKRTVRKKTEAEPIEVEKAHMAFKLGDKIESGVSVQYEPAFGLMSGVGVDYTKKFADRYDADAEVRSELEKDTAAESYYGSVKLGYSTLPAFSRGEFKVPTSIAMEYRRHLKSRNTPAGDYTQVDFNLFF
jgi:hypothetical protein